MVLAALIWAVYTCQFILSSVPTRGTVTELRPTATSANRTTYAPTFTYRDQKGQEHTVHSRYSSSRKQHVVGDSVPVRYRKSDPTDGQIDAFMYLWGGPAMFGVGGCVFGLFAAVLWIRRKALSDV